MDIQICDKNQGDAVSASFPACPNLDRDDEGFMDASAEHLADLGAALGDHYGVVVIGQAWGPFGLTTGFEITDLFANNPGQGAGTAVMTALCNRADELGMPILLKPSSQRNRVFYGRFGFEDFNRHVYGFMNRPPIYVDDEWQKNLDLESPRP